MHVVVSLGNAWLYDNRRLLSKVRSGCHGLCVDTGRWENNVHLDKKDRLCLVCRLSQHVGDEHQFINNGF